MASEIKLPELGENLAGGEVLDVRVAAGDRVRKGQSLIEVEAEKSTVEVPSPVDGLVARVLVKKGQNIKVGQTVCVIEDGVQGPVEAPLRIGGNEVEESNAVARPAQVPAMEKPPVEAAREIEKQLAATDRSGNGQRATPPVEPALAAPGTPTEPGPGKLVPAGPATRHLARELGVDLARVPGSGPAGRVTQDDVRAYVRQVASGPAPAVGGAGAAPTLPDFAQWGPVEAKALDGIRRKTAEQMALAWSQIPHVTQHDRADITDLDAFRKQQEGQGPKLTVTAFALKAVAVALKQFPRFNSSLDLANNRLITKGYYHVGVAVDTERGLLVPVLRDVDRKSVAELARELTEVAERARQKKIPLEEMRGGTFTLTNLGGLGGTGFTPIVNFPEVAILGLSRARLEPVVRAGQVVPRLILPLSLSYDHRVIDGADAARFTRRVADLLENPLVMLLHA